MSSSDSDSDDIKVSKKQQRGSSQKDAIEQYVIKPAKGGPSLDTSTWPLLLKVRYL